MPFLQIADKVLRKNDKPVGKILYLCHRSSTKQYIKIMATLTKEQIEQKKLQLQKIAEQVQELSKELLDAGVIQVSEEELEAATGGGRLEREKEIRDLMAAFEAIQKMKPFLGQ